MKSLCSILLLSVCFTLSVRTSEAKYVKFRSEEITFKSAGEISLSGTLTLPDGEGPFPAIVLLGGSERLERKAIYHWAGADSLVANGIAVFSFDSPGTGKSEGNRLGRTFRERTEDALAAIDVIRGKNDVKKELVGLYGVSEGGSIVFRAASRSKEVAFGIAVSAPTVPHYKHLGILVRSLAAGTGLKGVDLEKLITFNRLGSDLVRTKSSIDFAEMDKTVADWNDPAWSELISLLRKQMDENRVVTKESFIKISQKWEKEEWFQGNKKLRESYKQIAKSLGIKLSDLGIHESEQNSARTHIEFGAAVATKIIGTDSSKDEDPVSFLKQIECPILCIYGEKDYETSAAKSTEIITKAFIESKHTNFIVKTFSGAGHQLEVTEDKQTTRHKDFNKFVLDWVQTRIEKD